MKPNNIDLNSINPKNGDKYSPNLFKLLTNKRREIAATYGQVYRDKQGVLWLGYRDEEDWFMGARLIAVLCNGRKTDTFAHPPAMGRALVAVKDFWKRYVADGRCAIDKAHDMWFVGDASRWQVKGKLRTCLWCGRVQQKKVRFVKKVTSEQWVTV
jgi:hypothetical protein